MLVALEQRPVALVIKVSRLKELLVFCLTDHRRVLAVVQEVRLLRSAVCKIVRFRMRRRCIHDRGRLRTPLAVLQTQLIAILRAFLVEAVAAVARDCLSDRLLPG